MLSFALFYRAYRLAHKSINFGESNIFPKEGTVRLDYSSLFFLYTCKKKIHSHNTYHRLEYLTVNVYEHFLLLQICVSHFLLKNCKFFYASYGICFMVQSYGIGLWSMIIPVSFPPVVSLVILHVLQGHEHDQTLLCVLGQDIEVLSRLRTLLCFVGFTMRICIYEDSVYFMFV